MSRFECRFVEVLRHVLPESTWFRCPFTGDYGHLNQNQSCFFTVFDPPHFALKYRFNILEFLKNKYFGARVYGRSRGPRKVVYEARKDFKSA